MNSKKNTKKETAEVIYKKIGVALADLKGHVKQKKFDKQLQKVSNMLAAGIAEAAEKASLKLKKKKKTIKKAEKKVAGKKSAKVKSAVVNQANGMPVHAAAP